MEYFRIFMTLQIPSRSMSAIVLNSETVLLTVNSCLNILLYSDSHDLGFSDRHIKISHTTSLKTRIIYVFRRVVRRQRPNPCIHFVIVDKNRFKRVSAATMASVKKC